MAKPRKPRPNPSPLVVDVRPPPPVMAEASGVYVQVPPALAEALAPLVEQWGPLFQAGLEVLQAVKAARAPRRK